MINTNRKWCLVCSSCIFGVFVCMGLPGAFPLTYMVAIQPEVCIRLGEGRLIELAAMNAQRWTHVQSRDASLRLLSHLPVCVQKLQCQLKTWLTGVDLRGQSAELWRCILGRLRQFWPRSNGVKAQMGSGSAVLHLTSYEATQQTGAWQATFSHDTQTNW